MGIDLANRRPQLLKQELPEQVDMIVTMGCGDACLGAAEGVRNGRLAHLYLLESPFQRGVLLQVLR